MLPRFVEADLTDQQVAIASKLQAKAHGVDSLSAPHPEIWV
jgi:hypothetical protein